MTVALDRQDCKIRFLSPHEEIRLRQAILEAAIMRLRSLAADVIYDTP